MADAAYQGLLLIGDPHLEGRQPGFRKDDYPNVILEKLAWCLDYARRESLLPAILGDLFDKPRDNPNWLIGRLLQLLEGEILTLYGNHDVHYNPELTDDDSLSLLTKANRLRLVSCEAPWRGRIKGRQVIVGGASYRQPIPSCFELAPEDVADGAPFVVWLTHHDVLVPGYDEGRIGTREIAGVDLVVNGHIHRRLEDVPAGKTLWMTPGNISRRSRSDANRDHRPSALRIDIGPGDYQTRYIEVPHLPFEEVFHEAVQATALATGGSAFVAGLAELESRRTASGAGLAEFLSQNLGEFPPDVADEIRSLAEEVLNDRVE